MEAWAAVGGRESVFNAAFQTRVPEKPEHTKTVEGGKYDSLGNFSCTLFKRNPF